MKLSKKFLSKHIDISDQDFKELCDRLVLMGNEYEYVNDLVSATNLVIGQVIEISDHPTSEKLHVCKVDVKDEVLQIVCGAPNVALNKKVIVAKVGAKLPLITIKESTVRDVLSCGMMCSLEELGISKRLLKDEEVSGIHLLDDDAIVGEDPIKYLCMDDMVCEFELTSNRNDLLSVIGFAREVRNITSKPLIEDTFNFKESNNSINDSLTVSINTDKCSKILVRGLTDVNIHESSKEVKALLIASGIKPVNNVVDACNYCMIEYGIPMHVYDADKVSNIEVSTFKDGEVIKCIDEKEYKLSSEDIAIRSNDEAICIAGILGGFDSEVTNNTKNIYIECALFDRASIRKTSKKVIRTDASNRFEKGIDKTIMNKALDKLCFLLSDDATVLKDTIEIDNTVDESVVIEISLDYINKYLGTNITSIELNKIFDNLDFKYEVNNNVYNVSIAPYKVDLKIREDLLQEIAKSYGYANIKPTMPRVNLKKSNKTYLEKIADTSKRFLSSSLNEVITYSLVDIDSINMFDTEENLVTINNPLGLNRKYMRSSLLPSLIDVTINNYKRGNKDMSIFEIADVYSCNEAKMLTVVLSGEKINKGWNKDAVKYDYYDAKAIVCNYLNYLGFASRYTFESTSNKGYHPYKCSNILIDKKVVGTLGNVDERILDEKLDIYAININLSLLSTFNVRDIKVKEVSKYGTIYKDFAFIIDSSIESSKVIDFILKSSPRVLTSAYVFDLYRGENIGINNVSLGIKLTFEDPTKQLTNEEVNAIFNDLIVKIEDKFDAKVRSN